MKFGTNIRSLIFAVGYSLVPMIVLAQADDGSKLKNFNSVAAKLTNIGNTIIDLLIGFAVLWIIYNVVRYLVVGADSEDKRKTAGQAIMWGIIGIFVILSIWGLVNILVNTFVFNDNQTPTHQIPTIPTRSGSGVSSSRSSSGATVDGSAQFYNDGFLNGGSSSYTNDYYNHYP